MTAERGQAPGFIVVVADAPVPGAPGAAGRAATLVEAAAADHVVHLFVLEEGPPPHASVGTDAAGAPIAGVANSGGMDPVPGAHSVTRLPRGSAAGPRPARELVAEVAAQLGAVDARSVHGVLVQGLDLTPTASALADWLGVTLLVDAAGDHEGLLRAEQPDVATEPQWYLGTGCAGRASTVLVASSREGEQVARHLGAGRTVVVPDAAPEVPWQVGPPTGTGQVLARGDYTQPPDLAAARWLLVEVLPLLPEAFTLVLAGPSGDELRHLVNRRPGVRVQGPSEDLLAAYQFADVAVAAQPVLGGGRVPVLEAFRHKRAVVATKAAVDGLQAVEGIHVRTAEEPDAFAAAIMAAARPRTEQAEQLVADQVTAAFHLATAAHDPVAVRNLAADALSAATGARPRTAA